MKPKRFIFRAPAIFGTPLKYGSPVFIGFTVIFTGLESHAGDILRGGGAAASHGPRTGASASVAPPAATESARDNARDLLARTNHTREAMRAMQIAARKAAMQGGSSLGKVSSNNGLKRSVVPNGLGAGGLQVSAKVALDPSKWTGANAPTQTNSKGKTTVTIKQTEQQALLNWDSFNIGKKTTLTFDQSLGGADTSKWIAFNKITDPTGNPTQILGSIKADGQVYIINGNGIIFGGGSQVNARGLTASSLPVNDNLIQRGLLNNPDSQFLFSALELPGGVNGTPAFTPDASLTADGHYGDVTVQAGAVVKTPVSADGNGGRIMLVGANVTNSGELSSPAGQVILAAGLQVGVAEHLGSDPSLRGLDVYVGAVVDPASALAPYAGTVTHDGLVDVPRGSAWFSGKNVNQLGFIDSTTSVALNGRIDITANYDAVANTLITTDDAAPFFFKSTGNITLGEQSVTRILPEYSSTATTVGTELALRSIINIQGKSIHLDAGSMIFAPNALTALSAGNWIYDTSLLTSTFISSGGQVYLDRGAIIDLSGTKNVTASVLDNLLTLELRGSELAPAPLQRDGELRGQTITVDLGESGNYAGRDWIGTPLADLTGYVGLIQRSVSQLTAAGGSLDISAGSSVVMREGSVVDVSGGWVNFEGGVVSTTRVISGGYILDIAKAKLDLVYDGIYDGTSKTVSYKWGVSESFNIALAPIGAHFRNGYVQGADAGRITVSAPSMALDGDMLGKTVTGSLNARGPQSPAYLPQAGSLVLNFRSQDALKPGFPINYPSPPKITISSDVLVNPVADFATDANGEPLALDEGRRLNVILSTDLVSKQGFSNLTINNEEGDILVPESSHLDLPPGVRLSFTAGNISILGSIVAPGATLEFRALNQSPYDIALRAPDDPIPVPTADRGIFTLGSNARLSTAGLVTDDRNVLAPTSPISINGGKVEISAFTADLQTGGIIDVSGGYYMTTAGTGTYGNAGLISIKAGQDLNLPTVLGGRLFLGSTLKGFSGADVGTLLLQAPIVQVGGETTRSDALLLQSGFFNEGGFGDFTLIGLGVSGDITVPAVRVVEGTSIAPELKTFQVNADSDGNGLLSLGVINKPVGDRPSVSIHLAAPGVNDSGGLTVRGDVVVEKGAVVSADPGASVSVTGNTVSILGSIIAPGGNITVGGGGISGQVFGDFSKPLVTTYLGSSSIISAAGTTVLKFDPFGRRIGSVLNGGNITVSGNIAASAGAVIDVSGASGLLDFVPTTVVKSVQGGILTRNTGNLVSIRTRVDSNGGLISLKGGQMLFSDATLLGSAGGSAASGGALAVSSGRFYDIGVTPVPTDPSLVVYQSGLVIGSDFADDNGFIGKEIQGTGVNPLTGIGSFTIDTFSSGGFDSLSLAGVVRFKDSIRIEARQSLEIATGGILFADSDIRLSAPHVTLGKAPPAPSPAELKENPFLFNGQPFGVPPSYGDGNLQISASVIDLGDLSLQGIGNTRIVAANGDIRGSGTLAVSGNLELSAGQIYPLTSSELTFLAFDYQLEGLKQGSITVSRSGNVGLPLSAAGNLSLHASIIHQGGVLRAPFGTITLGWDGRGTAPVNLLTGDSVALPITQELDLKTGSITSVSAVDPLTGKGLTIPYGISPDGNSWIDPRGVDITASGPPEKSITLSADRVTTDSGSSIDLRGGGDLYAYRWVKGLGGPTDILGTDSGFAIIPGYDTLVAPKSPFNSSSSNTNLIANYGPGYVNGELKTGDRIYLEASQSLPAGYYTLLPARYALLPGAFLVSPSIDKGVGTLETVGLTSLVSGYRFNGLNSGTAKPSLLSRFEIAGSTVIRKRAEYRDFLANIFLGQKAVDLDLESPALPKDSGNLLFQASHTMSLLGSVSSKSISKGAGSFIDISTVSDIFITGGIATTSPDTITLNANTLNSFGAESLLIGGSRDKGADGSVITTRTENITVDTAGTSLSAGDLILVASDGLTLKSGSELKATGTLAKPAEAVTVSGSGDLVRVSSDAGATSIRKEVTSSSASLSVGSGVSISGGVIILDSSDEMSLAADANLKASAYSLGSGAISIRLDQAGDPITGGGLILEGSALKDLENSSSLSLLSYSSIDIHGSGMIGRSGLSSLTLNAGSIRGFTPNSGNVVFEAGVIVLGNSANVSNPGLAAPSSGTLTFQAGIIQMGRNRLETAQFDNVVLDAARHITGEGSGTFSVSGNLNARTPLITGMSGADHVLSAAGRLDLISGSVSPGARVIDGVGSKLSLIGSVVDLETDIRLPGGLLIIDAVTGNLTVGGTLDVSGSSWVFHDVTKFTDAGEIRLSAGSGDVVLNPDSILNISAPEGGGNAGILRVSVPQGVLMLNGKLSAKGGAGGSDGVFDLDAGNLQSFASLSSALNLADFTESQALRVRNGDVVIDGLTKTKNFLLSTDQGSITVSGTVDASGLTGGTIRLVANGDVTLEDGSLLTVAGDDFSAAGKGGSISLEAGSQRYGVEGTGSVDIQLGSAINLEVESLVAGNEFTPGSSASQGLFSGKLHLRAPRVSGASDLMVKALDGTITGTSSILVEGYKLYDLALSGGQIDISVRDNIRNDAVSFLGESGMTTAAYTAMVNRLLANNFTLEPQLILAPGVEIINRTGDLTLGSAFDSVANDWNLSGFRFGAKSAPGVLTLRASGNLNFFSALSDGFTPSLALNDATRLWLARVSASNPLLSPNSQSWSYRLAAGTDQTAVDFGRVLSTSILDAETGFLQLGNNATNDASSPGSAATTSSAIAGSPFSTFNNFQVIRTGSGDIEVHTGRSVQLLNQFATIYTAGTRVANPTLGGLFDLPLLSQSGIDSSLGGVQQSYPATFTMAGGNVVIHAGQNIEHLTRSINGEILADSQLQLPNNWLYRRGYVDPATGQFGANRWNESASTAWWVDFSNFFEGVGALGGGDVTMTAGETISNVDAVIPTNARMTGYTDITRTQKSRPETAMLFEFGGGDLSVSAGRDIDAGVYYIERGHGRLNATGEIRTNETRSVISFGLASENTELPTTLFLGKGGYDITGGGDVLLGPVANPFLLPGGFGNSVWHKTYFSTYSADAFVNVTSIGGSVTLRTGATAPGQSEGTAEPLLQSWITNKQLFSPISASDSKPWLRLSENKTSPFETLVSLMPGTLKATSLSGSVDLAGMLTLVPAATGTLELLADGSINGLQPNGMVTLQSDVITWGASRINLSDADPFVIPGVRSPFAYQAVIGDNLNAASITSTEIEFLGFINNLFEESGITNSVIEVKQALHAAGLLHLNDTSPVRLYTGTGDISGLTLFSPKETRVLAGRDIQDVSLYLQNLSTDDASVVSSGRDIVLYQPNSPLRIAAQLPGNVVNLDSGPQAGDVQISGPGSLQVLAGRNLDLGTGLGNSDGTGVGITSVGNARNASLGFKGANLVVSAGIGSSSSLALSNLGFDAFIEEYVDTPDGEKYLEKIAPGVDFAIQDDEERARLALEVFFQILRDAGRAYAETGNYDTAEAAIKMLFGEDVRPGEILTRGRDIRTANGGNIDITAPGGGLAMADTTIGNPLSPPGIITSGGGDISLFANNDINIGIGRIFTLRGGNEILWSSKGNIAAGASSKTVKSAPPTRVLIDPQSASVQTDLAGLATGGGIGVLASVVGVTPGNVDLIAPEGVVDAGDAGIRVTGNLNISATQVLNAGNISVSGNSAGTPAPASIGVNVGGLTAAASSSMAATASAQSASSTRQADGDTNSAENVPSIFTVEIIGYGGGDSNDEEDKKDKHAE